MALFVAAACSSSDPGPVGTASPAPLSGGPLQPGAPTSAPGSLGTADDEPCATETNFLTLVCATDADCAPVGYCEPYAASDAGAQLQAPELAAATGPGAGGSCVDPAAAGLSSASGPAGLVPPADTVPAADAPGEQADAGAWRPIGRCIPYESTPYESAPYESAPDESGSK